ncbi:MAG: DUF3341 domain-containing protein [Chitinophagaceae bacterium]|nr:DUF3341 domain-containing protein [Oligoflexus sp.]
MAKNTAVFGIFKDRFAAESAVDSLKTAGFRNSDISVLFPDNDGSREFAHEKATKAPEGATTGASSGAVLGGALGWLVGIGSLAIPGIGPFVAAGPIMAALAGAGIGGAVGGVAGALIGMGIPEFEAKRYEGMVKDGGILASVHCDDNTYIDRAKEILKASGAADISTTSEASGNVVDGTSSSDRHKHDGSLAGADMHASSVTTNYDRDLTDRNLRDRDIARDPTLPGL